MDPQPGWDSALGIRVEELTPNRVVAYVDIDERHQQPYGIVHGGVWASIVESVGSHGSALATRAITGQMAVVGTSNSTDFLRPIAPAECGLLVHRSSPAERSSCGLLKSRARPTARWWHEANSDFRT